MKNFLTLITGVAIGVGISWSYHKNKYEGMVQEEVESLRERIKVKENKNDTEEVNKDKVEVKEDDTEELVEEREKAKKIINYSKYSSRDDIEEDNISERHIKPFVVTPEDFASIPGFDTDTFYYHNNDIISNDNNEMVDNVEEILGLTIEEIKDQFGVYEDDSVYIRNTELKCDYEVLRENEDFVGRNGD